mgnify:CR=1 FL=1
MVVGDGVQSQPPFVPSPIIKSESRYDSNVDEMTDLSLSKSNESDDKKVVKIMDFEDSVILEERLLRLEKFVQILNAHDARSAHFIF